MFSGHFEDCPENTTFLGFFAYRTPLGALMVMIFWKYPSHTEWNQILFTFKGISWSYLKLFTFKGRVFRTFWRLSRKHDVFRVFFTYVSPLGALMVMMFWKYPKHTEWNQILFKFKVISCFCFKLFTFKGRVFRPNRIKKSL